MKKTILIWLCTIMFLIMLTACGNTKEVIHHGVNAEILEVNSEQKTILVKGVDENSILGNKCYVNCTNAYYIEVVDEEPIVISLKDLSKGDIITVDITEVSESYPAQTSTEHVQLLIRAE